MLSAAAWHHNVCIFSGESGWIAAGEGLAYNFILISVQKPALNSMTVVSDIEHTIVVQSIRAAALMSSVFLY
jgi:hypothetical protein